VSIVRLAATSSERVVRLHTDPADSQTMGRFGPARWSPEARAYLLTLDVLPEFERFAGVHGLVIVDERTRAADAPPATGSFRGPLPECRECGQPARRADAPYLRTCPACQSPWVPVIHVDDWRRR
jgi:hypothetical protein